MGGERRAGIIQNAMLEVLGKEADRTEYAMMVDRDFRPIETLDLGGTIVLVAAWIGKTRLIDNLWI
jgi:pantoate--beta-alanine ligase